MHFSGIFPGGGHGIGFSGAQIPEIRARKISASARAAAAPWPGTRARPFHFPEIFLFFLILFLKN